MNSCPFDMSPQTETRLQKRASELGITENELMVKAVDFYLNVTAPLTCQEFPLCQKDTPPIMVAEFAFQGEKSLIMQYLIEEAESMGLQVSKVSSPETLMGLPR